MVKLNEASFMTVLDMNTKYSGKWILVRQPNRNKFFEEGEVIAIGDNMDSEYSDLISLLEIEYNDEGYVYFANPDRGEELHVVFNKTN